MPPSRGTARLAGALYLALMPFGFFGIIYVPSVLVVPGDAATTSRNIMASEWLFRSATVSHLISQVIFIFLVLALLVILQFWWAFYRLGQVAVWSRYGAFLLLMFQLIVTFLLACAALPDEVSGRLDLEAYYDENRRYFWTLFALDALLAVAVKLLATVDTAALSTIVLDAFPNVVIAALLLSLVVVRSRVYHSALILLLVLALGLGWFPLRLG